MENKILFVDDSKTILALVSGLFKAQCQINCQQCATDALLSMEGEPLPDLIITDINMPGMDGYEFVSKLKSNSTYENIPVIVLSGNGESSERIRLYKMGVEEYLVKPFNPEELRVLAEKTLERGKILKINTMIA